ncbi:hypothetical protein FOA52_005981 [Chlamydomonas sp. UWO 241]|nr:hypothetical protein FOA52_005981 [Chlamydomonas sp. UWO 241]
MYEGETGERGFLAIQNISKGDVLLRVPLRLAFTDFADDEESDRLMYEGAPWSVCLSAKLLRAMSAGSTSPFWPYTQVLPKLVPAPMETLSWEQMQEIQYQPGKEALDKYNWLLADAYSSCSAEALGGKGDEKPSEEMFQWAMSVVHSRTFGNAAPGGGVGVRMLVPLVDMFNHGGDETESGMLNDPSHIPSDNVRWDVVQSGDDWEMVVTATTDVEPGYQLLLCYGARSNDDFFLHYGFVPEANPHESVVLFNDLEEALDWHHATFAAEMPEEDAVKRYTRALGAAMPQQEGALAELSKALGSRPEQKQEKQLVLSAGGRIDGALMTAFTMVNTERNELAEAATQVLEISADAAVLTGADARHAEEAVVQRCLGMLRAMPTTLLQDAAVLWADCKARGDEEGPYRYLSLIHHYRQALQDVDEVAAQAGALPIEAFALQLVKSMTGAGEDQGLLSGPMKSVVQYRIAKKMVLSDAVATILNAAKAERQSG